MKELQQSEGIHCVRVDINVGMRIVMMDNNVVVEAESKLFKSSCR